MLNADFDPNLRKAFEIKTKIERARRARSVEMSIDLESESDQKKVTFLQAWPPANDTRMVASVCANESTSDGVSVCSAKKSATPKHKDAGKRERERKKRKGWSKV